MMNMLIEIDHQIYVLFRYKGIFFWLLYTVSPFIDENRGSQVEFDWRIIKYCFIFRKWTAGLSSTRLFHPCTVQKAFYITQDTEQTFNSEYQRKQKETDKKENI